MNRVLYWKTFGAEPKTLKAGWFGKTYTLNELFEMAEVALGIFPSEKFTMCFVENKKAVEEIHLQRYGKSFSGVAFMSRSMKTAWFSLEDITPRVFIHECGHLLLESNQINHVSSGLHEGAAQFVERMIK